MEERTRLQNVILAVLIVMALVFGGVLIYNRTNPGILFRDEFLSLEQNFGILNYSGRCEGRKVVIRVYSDRGDHVDITAGDWKRTYTIREWEGELPNRPEARAVEVTEGGNRRIFQGFYDDGLLLTKSGELSMEGFGAVVTVYTTGSHYDPWEDYEPSAGTVLDLAYDTQWVHAGSVGLYVLMLFLSLLVAVDILYPELFFQLRHCMSVRDPEPSDFYIATQRIGWAVSPVLLLVGYYMAVTVVP